MRSFGTLWSRLNAWLRSKPIAEEFTIPDLLHSWPYPPQLNPHYGVLAPETDKWLLSFNAFTPEMQRAFTSCDFALIALRGIPKANKDAARAACYLMNLFFFVDEFTDAEDESGALSKVAVVKDVLFNPTKSRPEGEWIGGEVARQTFEATSNASTPTTQRRLLREYSLFLDSLVAQAKYRQEGRIPSFAEFLRNRRYTIGAIPVFTNIEMHMSIPDEASDHPIVQLLRICATDMVIITNDLLSYNVEQARGDDLHNSVTVIMRQERLTLQDAIGYLERYNNRVAATFLTARDHVPSFGDSIDAELRQYIDGMGTWVTGNYWWSFESTRYLGSKGLEVMNNRTVKLLPKIHPPSGLYMNIPE